MSSNAANVNLIQCHRVTRPPVKLIACPVMYPASSESRNQMAPAHSSAEPSCPSGTGAFRSLPSSSTLTPRRLATLSKTVSCIGVSMTPGKWHSPDPFAAAPSRSRSAGTPSTAYFLAPKSTSSCQANATSRPAFTTRTTPPEVGGHIAYRKCGTSVMGSSATAIRSTTNRPSAASAPLFSHSPCCSAGLEHATHIPMSCDYFRNHLFSHDESSTREQRYKTDAGHRDPQFRVPSRHLPEGIAAGSFPFLRRVAFPYLSNRLDPEP